MGLTKKSTKSEQLRNALFGNYQKEDHPSLTFDEYYDKKMDIIINHFKNKYNE